jgi:SCY1-like protein 2
MKDVYLLPFLLPDVFEICKNLTNEEFAEVLPRVQPLFDLKDSAQTTLMLIESIPMFAQKTSPEVFRKSESSFSYCGLRNLPRSGLMASRWKQM